MANIPSIVSKTISDKYIRDNNTFLRFAKENPKDRIRVEIGDLEQPDFKPQFKFMRWSNEVNFSLRAEEKVGATVETEGEKIKYITPEYEVHLYDKPELSEDGGFEFEWVLKQKPATNVLIATIETKSLDFFYQPPLTQKEIDEGASRPKNVEGSYAVYHKTKGGMNDSRGKEYKVGKAFHIYRPKVTDADGTFTWGDLHIDEVKGELTVTIPQKFLDDAVYPVVVDPTFGYTSKGASAISTWTGTMWGSKFSSPSDVGERDSISACGNDSSGSSAKMLVVLQSNLNIVTNGITPGVAFPTAKSFFTSNFSTKPTLSASTVYVLFIISNKVGFDQTYFDTGSANQAYDDGSNDYTTPTNPTDAGNSNNYKFSIYATYTVSGGTYEFVSNQEDTTAGSSPQTISINIGTRTNGLLVVAIAYQPSADTDSFSATYGGVAMSRTAWNDNAMSWSSVIFYLADP